MSPIEEKKFLTVVLSRIDKGPSMLLTHPRSLLLIWLGLVVASALIFAIAQRVPLWVSSVLFVSLGVLYSQLYFRVFAARGWGILGRYVDRQGIADRIANLEP